MKRVSYRKIRYEKIAGAAIAVALIAFVTLSLVVLFPSFGNGWGNAAQSEGLQYILEEETRDVSHINADLRKSAALEEISGMGLWEKLNYFDTYLIGDSRCEPFLWTGFQTEHLLTDKSTTIRYIGERMQDIADAKPTNLVLSFGMNDMGMYQFDPEHFWETEEEYAAEYGEYIKQIKTVSPDTNIYINSIIPAQPWGIEIQPRWAAVEEWNNALQELCSRYHIGYIDTTFIATTYADSFDEDGVHFYDQEIFEAWGEKILEQIEEKMFS